MSKQHSLADHPEVFQCRTLSDCLKSIEYEYLRKEISMLEKERDSLVVENARLNKLAFDLGIKLYTIQRILKSMFFGTSVD